MFGIIIIALHFVLAFVARGRGYGSFPVTLAFANFIGWLVLGFLVAAAGAPRATFDFLRVLEGLGNYIILGYVGYAAIRGGDPWKAITPPVRQPQVSPLFRDEGVSEGS